MPRLQVDEFLGQSARLHPEKVALVCGPRRLTYRELDDTANQLARSLQELGVRRGDRVVLHLENSVEAVISIFGILRAGAAFVPVGPTVKADKLAYILRDSEAVVLIADQRGQLVAAEALPRAPGIKATVIVGGSGDALMAGGFTVVPFLNAVVDPTRGQAKRPDVGAIDLDLAALVYTSGSTGRPKGVMLSHLNMVAAATSIAAYLENTEDDVILDVLPLSFDYGLYQVFLAFKVGARLILERSFVYTTLMLDLLVRERVTALPIVPTLAVLLLKHDLSAYDLSLRYITNTGAVLPPAHIAGLRAKFPKVRIYSMYGLTECKRVSFLQPSEIDARPTSVGKPMDNVDVYVADEDGNLCEAGLGELVIRGSNVMKGYWRSPEDTARVLKPGRFPGEQLLYTGDLFRIDVDGYLYFQGRFDDLIKSRGQRVSPKEVENVIYELPGVTATSVVGLPDEVRGSSVKAYVCLDGITPITEQEVLRHCSQRLEDFMVPRVVEFVDVIPTTDSGKLNRREMAAQRGTPASQPSA
ncbi:MAG TPA: AMP-binding protein [Microbacterium sp.]|nr:AMP-binding protein [Microbacterium sp.]